MKLHHLRSVREVVQNGLSLTRAAERLHASQPGLTRHVQLLERELGVPIFVRDRNRLVDLTPTGRAMLPLISRATDAVDDLLRMAREHAGGEAGALTVAMSPTLARDVIPPVARQFMQRHPHVQLRLRQGPLAQTIEWLGAGEADFTLSTAPADPGPGFAFVPCRKIDWIVLVPKGHPLGARRSLALADIAACPIITYDRDFSSRAIIDRAFEEAGLQANVVMVASDPHIMKKHVLTGIGIALVAHTAEDERPDARLKALRLDGLVPTRIVHIGLRQPCFLSRSALDFISLLAPNSVDGVKRLSS